MDATVGQQRRRLRSTVELAPTPFSVGLPTQRPFEAYQTLCFRHPSLPALERYFLPFPPESLPGKCFVSLLPTCRRRNGTAASGSVGCGPFGKPSRNLNPSQQRLPPPPAAPPEAEPAPEEESTPEEGSAPAATEEPAPPVEDEATSVPCLHHPNRANPRSRHLYRFQQRARTNRTSHG